MRLLWTFFLLNFMDSCNSALRFNMVADKADLWQDSVIPLWISPIYPAAHWRNISDILQSVQVKTNIRFRPFNKDKDVDYISFKFVTYGCYSLVGHMTGGERWINAYIDCALYPHTILRPLYQVLGFKMIAQDQATPASIFSKGYVVQIRFILFETANKTFIIDSKIENDLNATAPNGTLHIMAETQTHMRSDQPNMENYYWNRLYDRLLESFPYIETHLSEGFVFPGYADVTDHDAFHINREYKSNGRSPFVFADYVNASKYDPRKITRLPGVLTGINDLYCEDLLYDCEFLQASRGHCQSFQEFRYILCPRTCGMCGTNLRLYYITTHHPHLQEQTVPEAALPVCTDSSFFYMCTLADREKCILPSFRKYCRRSCGFCPELSRINCRFIRKVQFMRYLSDHPNYNYRCQYLRGITTAGFCESDPTIGTNPLTDCPLSCGPILCKTDGTEHDDVGYDMIPDIKLYFLPSPYYFATFASVARG